MFPSHGNVFLHRFIAIRILLFNCAFIVFNPSYSRAFVFIKEQHGDILTRSARFRDDVKSKRVIHLGILFSAESHHEDSRNVDFNSDNTQKISAGMQHRSDTAPDSTMLSMLIPVADCEARRMSSTDLAYIGDVVYELFVRSQYVWPSRRTKDLQKKVVALVRAEFQAELLSKIRSSSSPFLLTSSENTILSRGRNAVSGSSRNRNNKNPVAYQDATALEALIGYLYIADRARCVELFEWMRPHIRHIE